MLTISPVLMAPQLAKLFKIQVDASKDGVEAVLIQVDGAGIERPVCLFFRGSSIVIRGTTPQLKRRHLC